MPLTVSVYLPAFECDETLSVNVDVALGLTDAGEKLAFTPRGSPDTDRLAVCAVPLNVVIEIVVEALCPKLTLTVAGVAVREKALTAVTCSV